MRELATSLALFSTVIATAVQANDAAVRPADFSRRWVRSHPFTLMAVVTEDQAVEGNNLYAEAGMNTMLVWKQRPGPEMFKAAARRNLPWHCYLNQKYPLLEDVKSQVNQMLKTHPGGGGVLAWDEPVRTNMPQAAKRVEWIKHAHPELLVYVNVNPPTPPYDFSFPRLAGEKLIGNGLYDEPSVPYSYDDYLNDLAEVVKSDVLMGDVYPFFNPVTVPAVRNTERWLQDYYFFMLMSFRKAGLKHHLPYWMFVQSYADRWHRHPSESEVRMQVYSSLAFGCTGIAYFTYNATAPGVTGILDRDGSPTPLYGHIKALNAEVANLGQALRLLTCTDVRFVPATQVKEGKRVTAAVPRALAAFDSRSRVAKNVRDVVFQGTGPYNNAMVSFFRDDDGGKYVMVVNLQNGEGMSADATKAPIALTLDPSITAVYRLSRQTGKAEPMPLNQGKLEMVLPGGTGELLKLNTQY